MTTKHNQASEREGTYCKIGKRERKNPSKHIITLSFVFLRNHSLPLLLFCTLCLQFQLKLLISPLSYLKMLFLQMLPHHIFSGQTTRDGEGFFFQSHVWYMIIPKGRISCIVRFPLILHFHRFSCSMCSILISSFLPSLPLLLMLFQKGFSQNEKYTHNGWMATLFPPSQAFCVCRILHLPDVFAGNDKGCISVS